MYTAIINLSIFGVYEKIVKKNEGLKDIVSKEKYNVYEYKTEGTYGVVATCSKTKTAIKIDKKFPKYSSMPKEYCVSRLIHSKSILNIESNLFFL